ncbi:MAG: hypothetical protein AB1609_07645 [Bacillota bacterium]
MRAKPIGLVAAGLLLLVLGWVLPFLMVVRILPPSFLLSFVAYAASLIGLAVGLFGLVEYVRSSRHS